MSRYRSALDAPFTRRLWDFDEMQPETFLHGDPVQGFHEEIVPMDLSYWGVLSGAKALNMNELSPGNMVTFLANTASSILGSERRFISLGAAMQQRYQLTGDPEGGDMADMGVWRWLSNRLSPIQATDSLRATLDWRDEEFDAEVAYAEWVKANAGKADIVRRAGLNPEVLRDARNRDGFVYLANRIQAHAQAIDSIREYEDQAGILKWAANRVQSGIFNWMLTDPTTLPTMAVPFGVLTKAGQAASLGARVSARAARLGLGPRVSGAIGKTIASPLTAAESVHAGMARAVGAAGAYGIETAALGAGFNFADQQQRIADWNRLIDSPEFEMEYSYAEMGLAAGISGVLGGVIGGIANPNRGNTGALSRQASILAADGTMSHPQYHRTSAVIPGALWDDATVRISREVLETAGHRADDFSYLLDDHHLSSLGLTRIEIDDFFSEIALLKESGLPINADILDDLLTVGISGSREVADLNPVSRQIYRQAYSRAWSEAVDELPPGSSSAALRARANATVARHLKAISDEVTDLSSRPVTPGSYDDFLEKAAAELNAAAAVRDLAPTEIEEAIRLDRLLRGRLHKPSTLVDIPDGIALGGVTLDAKALKGASRRWAEALIAQRQTIALENADVTPWSLTLGGGITEIPADLGPLQGALRDRREFIARIQQKLAVEMPPERPARIVTPRKPEAPVPVTKADDAAPEIPDPQAALLAKLESGELNPGSATLVQDQNVASQAMRVLLGPLSKFALRKTGISQTVRSGISMIRRLAAELDNNKLVTDHLASNHDLATTATNSLMQARRSMNEMLDTMVGLVQKGKFGSSIFRPFNFQKKVAEFEAKVYRVAAGLESSGDPDVQKMVKMWADIRDHIAKVGVDSKQWDPDRLIKNYVPLVANVGVVQRDLPQAIDALGVYFQKHWDPKDIHMDTLVEIGVAKRIDSRRGARGWESTDDTLDLLAVKTPDDLPPDIKVAYDIAFKSGVAFNRSAARAWEHMLGGNTTRIGKHGEVILHRTSTPSMGFERQLPPGVLGDPSVAKYFSTNWFQQIEHYISTTGFRILNNARHADAWGVPGLTMRDTLDVAEALLTQKHLGKEVRESVTPALTILREKLATMEGHLPTLRSESDGIGERLADVAVALPPIAFGSRIGGSIMSTEGLQSVFGRIHSLDQLMTRPLDVLKTFVSQLSPTGRREFLQVLSLAHKMNQHHSMQRFTGGSITSSYHWGFVPKILGPWQDFMNLLAGRTGAVHLEGGNQSRRWDAASAGLRALGANIMTLGGSDWGTNFVRSLQVVTLQKETGHFFRAAEKMAKMLEDGGDARLSKIYSDTLAATGSERKAATAKAKEFRSLARRAGFTNFMGMDMAQAAFRMASKGLLNSTDLGILRTAGEATGALKDSGISRILDVNLLSQYGARADLTPVERQAFSRAYNRLLDTFEETIRSRISEPSVMQTPTSATDRTSWGRTMNAMTTFARSAFDNNVLGAAAMPLLPAMSMLGILVTGETLNRILREMHAGKPYEDIVADMEADPAGWAVKAATSYPLLGQYTMAIQALGDHMVSDGNPWKTDTQESAATASFATATNAILDVLRYVSPLRDGERRLKPTTVQFGQTLIPGYQSYMFKLLAAGLEEQTGVDISGVSKYRGSYHSPRVPKIPGIVVGAPVQKARADFLQTVIGDADR